jgi:hypothetical protein
VGGIEASVDQPDQGLGRQQQFRIGPLALTGGGGLERDRLAGFQREVPLRVSR